MPEDLRVQRIAVPIDSGGRVWSLRTVNGGSVRVCEAFECVIMGIQVPKPESRLKSVKE